MSVAAGAAAAITIAKAIAHAAVGCGVGGGDVVYSGVVGIIMIEVVVAVVAKIY